MDKATKQGIIEKYAVKSGDTGSTVVQIAVLSEKIKELTAHMQKNKKDFSTRRGLLAMVSRRRRLLKYLNQEDHERFLSLTDELGIRRAK